MRPRLADITSGRLTTKSRAGSSKSPILGGFKHGLIGRRLRHSHRRILPPLPALAQPPPLQPAAPPQKPPAQPPPEIPPPSTLYLERRQSPGARPLCRHEPEAKPSYPPLRPTRCAGCQGPCPSQESPRPRSSGPCPRSRTRRLRSQSQCLPSSRPCPQPQSRCPRRPGPCLQPQSRRSSPLGACPRSRTPCPRSSEACPRSHRHCPLPHGTCLFSPGPCPRCLCQRPGQPPQRPFSRKRTHPPAPPRPLPHPPCHFGITPPGTLQAAFGGRHLRRSQSPTPANARNQP